MDRLVRARLLLAETEALGVTIDDLVAAASSSSGRGSSRSAASVPTLAEYVETVAPSFSANTASTYRCYWRVAVARFGDRPVDALDADDCEAVLADAVAGYSSAGRAALSSPARPTPGPACQASRYTDRLTIPWTEAAHDAAENHE
jgi:hypothetical protein